jgi:hypothetical protein
VLVKLRMGVFWTLHAPGTRMSYLAGTTLRYELASRGDRHAIARSQGTCSVG